MSEHKNPEGNNKINLDTIAEINYWTKRFNCNEAELRKIIKTTGSSAVTIVEKFFEKSNRLNNFPPHSLALYLAGILLPLLYRAADLLHRL
jgi:hypothetical protein